MDTVGRYARAILLLMAAWAVMHSIVITIDGLRDELGKADVAVVFGSTVDPTGVPSDRLKARLDKALELYGQKYFPKIIVSGGLGNEGYNEAVVMRDYLTAHNVPSDSIILDSTGTNSMRTARHAAQIMERNGMKSVMIISQFFHISRAKLAFSRSGVDDVYSAHAEYFEWKDFYSTGREVIGYYAYLFK